MNARRIAATERLDMNDIDESKLAKARRASIAGKARSEDRQRQIQAN
jgi:hypothetical protein